MDNNNMNGGPEMDPNQQPGGVPEMDPNQQMDPSQQMYNQQMDPNQQMYNQQMYDQQMYANQQMYGQQMDPNQQMYEQPDGQAPAGEKKTINLGDQKNLIIMVVAAVVALVLIVSIFRGVFGRGKQSPKAVAKAIATAYENEKPKKIYRLYDRKYLNYLEDEGGFDKDDVLDMIEDEIDDFYDTLKWYDVGKVKRIKVEIEDVDKAKGKGLREGKKYIKDEMDIRVSQIATVDFEWEVIGKDDDYDADGYAMVYKRMGKWYLMDWYVY